MLYFSFWKITTCDWDTKLKRLNSEKFPQKSTEVKLQILFSDFGKIKYCKVSLRNLILENSLNMCDEDYHNLTGLLYDHFEDLVSRRSSSPKSAVQSTWEVTGLLLTKLRKGMYHSNLATYIGLTDSLSIEKSSSYTQQRRYFSMHKDRLLIKRMRITCTDRYIVSVWSHLLQMANIAMHKF